MARYIWDPDYIEHRTPAMVFTKHVHPCPECYEHPWCTYDDCTIEPDLQRDDGTLSGSYVVCDDCKERKRAKKEYERKLVNESAQKWLDCISQYDPRRWPYDPPPEEYIPGDVWDKLVIDNEVIVLRQDVEQLEESTDVCHCGSAMEDHTQSDNHGAVEMTRIRELRILVRHDTDEVVAFDEWGFIQPQPKFSMICGGPRCDLDGAPGCGRSDCMIHLERLSQDMILAVADFVDQIRKTLMGPSMTRLHIAVELLDEELPAAPALPSGTTGPG
jgi:hypothetical protein